MTVEALQSQLDELDQPALYAPERFQERAEAIDEIGFAIVDRIDGLLAYPAQPQELRALRRSAEQLLQRLEDVDEQLFQHVRSSIRAGCRGKALQQTIERYVGASIARSYGQAIVGYDSLDRFLNGLLSHEPYPETQRELEPEMVLYQKTPARIGFELAHRANLGPQDVFYDLGSGLGHVATLVHLLSGAQTRGVEFEPAFCAYAQASANALGLNEVTFLNSDARRADYSAGSFFYLYTPFEGAMLQDVLQRLRERAGAGPIRLATYGPCTPIVAQQDWLSAAEPGEPGIYRLAIFRSLLSGSDGLSGG